MATVCTSKKTCQGGIKVNRVCSGVCDSVRVCGPLVVCISLISCLTSLCSGDETELDQ